MSGIALQVGPVRNYLTKKFTTASAAAYKVIGNDGSVATAISSLAAGVKPMPGLDAGGKALVTTISGETVGGAAHGGFLINFNSATQPADDTNALQIQPGQSYTFQGHFQNIWIRQQTATDILTISVGY